MLPSIRVSFETQVKQNKRQMRVDPSKYHPKCLPQGSPPKSLRAIQRTGHMMSERGSVSSSGARFVQGNHNRSSMRAGRSECPCFARTDGEWCLRETHLEAFHQASSGRYSQSHGAIDKKREKRRKGKKGKKKKKKKLLARKTSFHGGITNTNNSRRPHPINTSLVHTLMGHPVLCPIQVSPPPHPCPTRQSHTAPFRRSYACRSKDKRTHTPSPWQAPPPPPGFPQGACARGIGDKNAPFPRLRRHAVPRLGIPTVQVVDRVQVHVFDVESEHAAPHPRVQHGAGDPREVGLEELQDRVLRARVGKMKKE